MAEIWLEIVVNSNLSVYFFSPHPLVGKFGSQLSDSNEDLISGSQGGNGAGPSKI